MMNFSRSTWLLLSIGLGILAIPGCGKRYITVSGTVELPKDVKLAETDLVQITFVPDAKGEKSGFAVFNTSDKTFVCKDVLPGGKYKIAAKVEPAMGQADSAKRAPEFAAFNKTFEAASTKLVYQATEDSSQSIAIDFVKSTVSKK